MVILSAQEQAQVIRWRVSKSYRIVSHFSIPASSLYILANGHIHPSGLHMLGHSPMRGCWTITRHLTQVTTGQSVQVGRLFKHMQTKVRRMHTRSGVDSMQFLTAPEEKLKLIFRMFDWVLSNYWSWNQAWDADFIQRGDNTVHRDLQSVL